MSQKRVPNLKLKYRYYRYMNKLEKEVNLKLGFGLFATGVVLAALALAVVLYAVTSGPYLTFAAPGYALALVALPLVLLGSIVLLPPDRTFILAGGVGLLACLGATAGFLWLWPDWGRFGASGTTYVMVAYALGAGVLTLGMAASMREHAPELIETVTQIHRPEPDHESTRDDSGSAPSGNAVASGANESSSTGGHAPITDGDDGMSVGEDVPAETAVVDAISDGEDAGSAVADGAPAETAVIDDANSGRAGTGEGDVTLVMNGRRYTFGDGDTFGRRDEPWLDDLIAAADGHDEIPYVSSEHVEFSVEDDGVYVTDVSRNGTKLNGRDVSGETERLSDGDTLILADRAKVGVEL